MFQFQSGAIQRFISEKDCKPNTCFNSKVVRFKVKTPCKVDPFNSSFNSKVVRFKVRLFRSLLKSIKFQFQSGAIQRSPFPDANTRRPCFNSKVVRFKAISSTGASKASVCFNSKVARFKVFEFDFLQYEKHPFQFQSGAIQSQRAGN